MGEISPQPPAAPTPARRIRLLVVDHDEDPPAIGALLQEAFDGAVETTSARDLRAGLGLLASGNVPTTSGRPDDDVPFDCVLLGLGRSDVDATDALRQMREACPGVLPSPVIVLDERDDPETIEALFAAGADDRIATRSLSAASLHQAVTNAMARRAARRGDTGREVAHARPVLDRDHDRQQSEDLLRGAIDQIGYFVGVCDREGTVRQVNRTALEACGVDPEDVVGRPFHEAAWWRHDLAERERVRESVARAAHGESSRFESTYRATEGSIRAVDHCSAPLRDASGNVTAVVVSGVDITDRKIAEQRLRESEGRLRLFIEHAPAAIAMFDREMCYLAVSRRWLGDYGLPADILGRSHIELFPDLPEKFHDAHRRGLAGETLESEGDCYLCADGAAQWLKWELRPWRTVAGEVGGIIIATEDITEQRRSEERVRESESRLREIFTSIDEGYCLCEMLVDDAGQAIDYRFLEVNPLFEEFTGIRNAVGKTAYTEIPGLEPHWCTTYARAALGGETLRFEQWAEPMGKWFDVYAAPTQGERRFIIVFKDVTQRKLAESRLRASEERLAMGTEVAGLALAEFDYTTDEVRLGGEAARLFGLGEGERSVSRAAIHATFHPDDRPELLWRIEDSLDPQGTGEFGMDHRIVDRTDGTVRWLRVRKRVFFAGTGKARRPARGMLAAFDVTTERRAEEAVAARERELRSVTANIPDIIARFDRELRHIYVNEAVTEATGLPPEAFLGKTNRELGMPGFLVERWDADMRKVFETGRPLATTFAFRAPDHERHYFAKYVPEFDAAGRVTSLLVVTRDATDQHRLEERMRHSMEEAERANAAKDHFLAILSHELRTPLTPVLAAASELTRRGDLPDDARRLLAMIHRNVALEGRLVDDLLDLTRVARGKLDLEFTTIDVHDSIDRVVEMVAAEAENRQVTLAVGLAAGAFHVLGDGARMQQILWNLLENAVKFTLPGGTVSLTTADVTATGAATGQLRVVVRDTGVGIAPQTLPSIFEAFEQGGATVTRRFGGMGLGLAITKALVEEHGGTIRAESAGPDRGATFTLELPTVAAAGSPPPEPSSGSDAAGLRVLLVEDHADTAETMTLLLEPHGLTVRCSASVNDALEALGNEHFDVLVSDLGLPDGSGHDLLRRMRATGSAVPGIALSGFGSEKDRRGSAAAGFEEHMTKPVDFERLVEAIRRVAGRTAKRSDQPPVR